MPLLSRPRPAAGAAPSLTSRVPLWALAASLATAAGIHLAVGYGHGFVGVHGTFFVLAGIIQAVGAAVVARHPSRRFIALAAVGSAALLATWLVERTPGLSGGDALDPLATATAVAEVVSVVAAVRLLARPPVPRGHIPGIAALAVVALVAVGSGGLAGDGHGDHHHTDEPVLSDETPREPSSDPGLLRPVPVTPTGDHHGNAPDEGVSEVEAVPVAPTSPALEPAPAPADDHHDDEDAPPHDH